MKTPRHLLRLFVLDLESLAILDREPKHKRSKFVRKAIKLKAEIDPTPEQEKRMLENIKKKASDDGKSKPGG